MKKIEREIDLKDMVLNWGIHWKSLIVFVALGVVYACMLLVMENSGESPQTVQDTELSAEELRNRLSEADALRVERIVYLRHEYNDVQEEYEAEKDKLSTADRIQALYNLLYTNYSLDQQVVVITTSYLTSDQQAYYYALVNEDTKIQNSHAEPTKPHIGAGDILKRVLLIACTAVFFHFVLVSILYVFDKRIKHTDNMYLLTDIPEYTRVIDWEKIDKERGIDRLINRIRYKGQRKTPIEDIMHINAMTTANKMQSKQYHKIAVVGPRLQEERDRMIDSIKGIGKEYDLRSIDSIAYSVNGSDDIVGAEAAVMIVKAGFTRYEECMKEICSLRDGGVDIFGIVVYE